MPALFLFSHGLTGAFALTCISQGRLLFPPPGVIPPNPVFLLQLEGATGVPAEALTAETLDLHFLGGHVRVRMLERGGTLPGYIAFTPVEPLRAGTVGLRLFRTFDGGSGQWTHLGTFEVRGVADATDPTLTQLAEQVTARVRESLVGEDISVELPITADESPVLWLATIDESAKGIPRGRPVTMYLPAMGPSLHTGPCGGNYPLQRGRQYRVELTPIDSAGHRGQVGAPPILVDIP